MLPLNKALTAAALAAGIFTAAAIGAPAMAGSDDDAADQIAEAQRLAREWLAAH